MLYGRNLPASQAPFPPPKVLCQGEPKAPPNWAALLHACIAIAYDGSQQA